MSLKQRIYNLEQQMGNPDEFVDEEICKLFSIEADTMALSEFHEKVRACLESPRFQTIFDVIHHGSDG